jgi:hypothetical protein
MAANPAVPVALTEIGLARRAAERRKPGSDLVWARVARGRVNRGTSILRFPPVRVTTHATATHPPHARA